MNEYSEITSDLRCLPCLSVLREEDLASLREISYLKNLQKDASLFNEAQPVEFFYIVKKGALKLFKTSEEGRELIVRIMGDGDYFCCAPLYSGSKYFVGAAALEDSTLIAIPSSEFKKTLRKEVSEVGWKIISGLCNKIHYLSSLIENFTFRDVEERVVMALLRMAEERPSDKGVVTLTITHQDIASMTGTVREVVSRTMSRLKKDGIIVDSSIKGFTLDKERLLQALLNRRVPSAL